jgi:hypothetical protein
MKYIIFDSNNRSIGALDCYEVDLAINTPAGTTAVASNEHFKDKMLVNGAVVSIPESELDTIALAEAEEELRAKRNVLLKGSDFSQMPDAPFTEAKKLEWQVYRQALRDLPDNVVDMFNPIYPTPPA